MGSRPITKSISRLPVWAQTYIQSLEREVDKLKIQVNTVAQPNSNVVVKGTYGIDEDTPVFPFKEIRFRFNKTPGRVTERFIDVRHDRDRPDQLVVMSDSTIHVEPHATNSIRLIIEP